jgi:SNF2 family DNA or RNA helicase
VKGKIAGVIDWVKNFLETEEKLVIFANHRSVVEELSKEFNTPCIYGGMNINKRQEAIDSFQNNPNVRVIVCNMKAAGVGITLTAASNVAFIELGWNPADHDQAEDRCHRIGQKNAVTAWYLLADETIAMDVSDLIEKKRDIVEHAADGKRLENIGMINALFSRLTEEHQNDQD